MDKKKILKNLIIVLVLAGILVFNIPFPMSKTIDALEIKMDDPNYLTPVKINLNGTYRVNLFSSDNFEGFISIDGYVLTESETPQWVNMQSNWQYLSYFIDPNYISSLRPIFGRIYSIRNFREFIIQPQDLVAANREDAKKAIIKDGTVNFLDRILIVSNVKTREEAIQKIYQISPPWINEIKEN